MLKKSIARLLRRLATKIDPPSFGLSYTVPPATGLVYVTLSSKGGGGGHIGLDPTLASHGNAAP
jgi:hypothetical protein